ncbi:MAG TPA: hypothetical protein VFX30_02770, partial [bacterium]|nr:hypothetical protein [bacterium]
QIGQNKAKIAEEFNKLTGFIPTGPVVEPINPNKVLEKFGFASPNFPALDVDMPSPEPVDPIKQLEKLNEVGQDLINRTEAHFLELIAQAHPNDTYQQHIEAATAFAIGGNHHKALEELQDARRQFKFGPVVVPSTPENMAKEITVLHRIVGVSGISYDLHDEVLKESRELIKELKKESPDQAALFTVENMELQASLNSDRGALHIGSPNNSDDENEAAANRYHAGVRKGQMDIVDFCEKALKDVKDPGTREALGARMFQARAAVLELDLGEALVEHEKDEKDVAERISANALKQFNDFAAKHKDVPNAAGYAEGMGRARLAEGYYQFRTGKIEESIATLKAIKKDYPESTASLKISGRGFWPNEAGIVDGDGNITDTDKEDVMAAITTAASKLNKEKGRGLAACGIGAGLFIAADLALGEKVSGVAVASACVAGYVVDRALLIAESSNEIAASYRTGVSTATVGDALLATGEFVLNIACMYMGGAAGGLAEKVVLNYGSRLGGELTGFLLSAGLKPGPWTRAAGEFALTESAYVANAVAFHKTSGFLNQTGTALMHGQMPSYKDTDTAEDYFVSWLFVRVMPMAMEANPGGKVIRNETAFDRSVQKAVNMGYGGVVIQELRAIFTKDPSQVSLNALGNTAWDLFFIHHGNHALESAIPMKSVAKFSRTLDLQTRNNLESIRKAVDEAPSAGSWWDQSFGWIKTGGTPPEPIKTDDSGVTNDPPPLLARENPVTDPTDMTPPYLHNKLKFTTDFKFPSDPVLIVDPKSVPTQQTPVDPKAIATEPGAPKGDATLEVAVNGKSAAKDLSPEAKAEQDRLERIFSEAIEATKNGKLLGPEQQKAMAKLTSLQLINAKNMNAALENPFHVSAMETLANAGGELGRMAREFGDLAKSTRKKIGEYEKKVDAYHRSGEAKDLLEAENYFDKELDKDLAKLRSSDYFKLNEAFDQNVALAEAAIEPLTFDLASREIQAGKEKPIGFRVHVKSLDELNLDANDPAGSLAKLDPKELITVEVRTTDEAQKNEIEKAIKD